MSNPLALAESWICVVFGPKKKQQNLKGYTHDISLNCSTCQTKILWNLWLSNVTAKLICFVAPPSLCLSLHIFFYPILREPLNKIFVQCHCQCAQNPSLDNTYQLQIIQWSYVLKSILTQHFCPFCPAEQPPSSLSWQASILPQIEVAKQKLFSSRAFNLY